MRGLWIYRGQSNASWSLRTSLERATTIQTGRFSGQQISPAQAELSLLQDFKRRAHHYISSPPQLDDAIEWLALMQHYGVPTRLLDWTYSPYVGLYFAVEGRDEQNPGRALWAIDLQWLRSRSELALRQCEVTYSEPVDLRTKCKWVNHILLMENNPAVVIEVEPLRVNDRMAAQQGALLCNLAHIEPFDESLSRMIKEPQPPERPVVRKLAIKPSGRIGFLQDLNQANVTGASLFPGLDGFVRSLRINLAIEIALRSRELEQAI